MEIDRSHIQALIDRPTEGLNVEIKRWINTNEPEGLAKIVRAALAMRNRNGGYLIIGFDDKTSHPEVANRPEDVRAVFHVDKIQGIISRYSSDLFEIAVVFVERDSFEYPVIVVPEGVRTPVAAKAAISDQQHKAIVSRGDVYFRTLAANGTVSTSAARPEDWKEIVEICFNNREADIGRFLRRHFVGADAGSLVTTLAQFIHPDGPKEQPTLEERALQLLRDGNKHFIRARSARTFAKSAQKLFDAAEWNVALVLEPARANKIPNRTFLSLLSSSNPDYTGWPIWLDSTGFTEKENRPKNTNGAWEMFIVSTEGWSSHLDFSRFEPGGAFYLKRALPDDLTERVQPRTTLDPILVMLRVAEAIAVGLAFGKALGWDAESSKLGFAFSWNKLAGRLLDSWTNRLVTILPGFEAVDDEITTYVELSLDTPVSAIAPYVEQATDDLFASFGGYKMPKNAVEYWCQRLVERGL